MSSTRVDYQTTLSTSSDRPSAPSQTCLVVVSGPIAGELVALRQRETVLGRGEDCHIQLRDDSVSRRHALVTSILDRWLAIDLGSTNGTFINDVRIERAELKEGDLLRVGKVALKLVGDRHEQEYLRRVLELANTDALTGLHNRRHFDEAVGAELVRPASLGGQHSLILFDVDRFKAVNDDFGHRTGDAVLKHLASVAKSQLTRGRILYRTGGEEFAVFLANTPHSLARVSAELIRQAVETATFNVDGVPIQVTVSLGVARSEAADTLAHLYERADKLLYLAKANGRNRVA
jgi:two-component system, cell cycle response regulator